MKNRFAVAVIILIAVNVTGILLRLNELDTYFIVAGFRFHISMLLSFILCYGLVDKSTVTKTFRFPQKISGLTLLILITGPIILGTGVFYISGLTETGDPEYFYELGLSSLIDYPVYLIWNFPQFILGYLAVRSLFNLKSGKSWLILLFIPFLYLHELYPTGNEKWGLFSIAELLLFSIFISGILTLIRNIYWAYVIIFSLFWTVFLSYGSSSKVMIAQLFAYRYSAWEGFFAATSNLSDYLIVIHLSIAALLLLIVILINKAK